MISRRPAHPALVSEADFIAAQDAAAPRGPAGPAARRYLLAGPCGRCGLRLESAWSNGRPAYRCRHGYTSAASPDPARPKNAYVREDQILPHLAAVGILLAGDASGQTTARNGVIQLTAPARIRRPDRPAQDRRRHPDLRPGHADHTRWRMPSSSGHHRRRPLTSPESSPERRPSSHSTRSGRRPGPGDVSACPQTAAHGELTCPRLEHADAGNLPGSGKSCRQDTGQSAAHGRRYPRAPANSGLLGRSTLPQPPRTGQVLAYIQRMTACRQAGHYLRWGSEGKPVLEMHGPLRGAPVGTKLGPAAPLDGCGRQPVSWLG